MPVFHLFASLGLALVLAGCSGIGDGNRPESMKILPAGEVPDSLDELVAKLAEPPEETQVFTCLGGALRLLVSFEDGDIGDFGFRARWTSSNENVVQVSNGDLLAEGSSTTDENLRFFSVGGLKPIAEGTATITANYRGMTATIPVRVRDAFKNADGTPRTDSPFVLTPAKAFMAPTSVQAFAVEADLDGTRSIATTLANIAFVDADDDVATYDPSAALVTAVAPGATQTLRARFSSPCAIEPTAQVYVSDLQSLSATYEEGFTQNLVGGTSQYLRFTGNFGDLDGDGVADTQDLSSQAAVENSDAAVVTAGGLLAGRNLVIGAVSGTKPSVVGTANLTARFGQRADPDGEGPEVATPGTAAPALPVTVLNVAFSSMVITPAEPQTLAPLETTRLKAIGTYSFDGQSFTQDISRHVTWSSSNAERVGIVSGLGASAGTAIALQDSTGGTVTITATLVQGVADATVGRPVDDPADLVQTTTLNVVVPAEGT